MRRFLHQLFATVESGLIAGEVVHIEGIGDFTRGESPDHPVLFRPDQNLSVQLNEPFAAFDPVELNEGAEQEFGHIDAIQASVQPTVTEGTMITDTVPELTPEISVMPEDEVEETVEEKAVAPIENEINVPEELETQETSEKSIPVPDIPEDEEDPDNQSEPEYVPEQSDYHTGNNNMLWLLLGILIGVLIGLFGGYFAGKYMRSYAIPEDFDMSIINEDVTMTDSVSDTEVTETVSTITETVAPEVQEKQSVSEQKTAESHPKATSTPVYDTITRARYLSILAKEHYGVKNYWIFIYQANPELGNPNKIVPGTRVLIPDRSSFEEATPEATAAKASRLMGELSKKYKF